MTYRHATSLVGPIELSICVTLFGIGCYGPNPNYTLTNDYVVDSDDPSEESSTDAFESGDETGDETDTETDTGEDTTESGSDPNLAPPNPSCGDKTTDVGEFCYEFAELLGLIDVQSLTVADFDGDGFRDLAVGRKDDVLVLFGDGAGGFPRQADLPEPNSNYFGAASGDLDGDEIPDLVVSRHNGAVVLVYRSLGGGDFAEPVAFATGDNPQRLALARLDRDFTLDLVVASSNDDTVDVLLGDGLGGFGAPTPFASGGDEPVELGFGSFDQDSLVDLVVGNFNDKTLAILLGAGSGQLAVAQVYPLLGKPRSTVIADFDLDGHLDIAAALEDTDSVQLLYGDGLGGLVDDGVELAVGDRPMGAVAGDFNLDGLSDLLVINRDDATVSLLLGDLEQPGQFELELLLAELEGLAGMRVVISADINHDGVVDVIIGGAGIRAMISNP